MKKTLLSIIALMFSAVTANAIDDNTVEITFSGTTAKVTVASNISSYVTVSSGTSSHVKLVQSASFEGINKDPIDNEDGEIFYVLKGSSDDGEFFLEGSYKCEVVLNGITLTNPSGPAINIQNGKRVAVSIKKNTTNTLVDGSNADYNGAFHCKGHTKFKGKGTLNVKGNSMHAIYSKEYVEMKNAIINVTAAKKDGIHCKEYFFMESGTLNISGVGDDGIQVELSSDPATGITAGHEDENTGNFYMADGKLTISSFVGKAIKADGSITYSGGTQNFSASDTEQYAGIEELGVDDGAKTQVYDLNGRRLDSARKGLYILRQGEKALKKIVK